MNDSELTARIIGLGKAVPQKILTNADLEKMVDTSDAWIVQRVGIRERRIAAQDEFTSDLAFRAAKDALQMSGLAAEELDLIVVATSTPDTIYPSVASLVQSRLKATKAGAIDISAACTGFVYGANLAWGMIRSGLMQHVLVIGAEVNSSITDWEDRDTCILFGDGAGAALFTAHQTTENDGVLAANLGSDGDQADLLEITNSGCRPHPKYRGRYIRMLGNEVFKQAVRNMYESAKAVIQAAGLTTEDVALLIAHQANTRIIDAVAKRLRLPPEKVFVNIQKYGNTSAATIPIAMCEALAEKRIKPGDVIVLDAFGAGLTWGSMAIRWV